AYSSGIPFRGGRDVTDGKLASSATRRRRYSGTSSEHGPGRNAPAEAVLRIALALPARDRQALRVPSVDRAGGTLALRVSSSSSALRGIVKRSCIVASSSVRLRTMQQYSSDRPLGSLK